MKSKYIKTMLLLTLTAGIIYISSNYTEITIAAPTAAQQTQTAGIQYLPAEPLKIVANPNAYLNKNVLIKAKFDKFSTLGLDYKPAFKSSDDYISFLIKRDDTTYSIPLSEMKLFIKRTDAEKFIDIKTNDEIQIKGKVFSDALGDVWVDVSELTITKKAPEEVK